MISPSDIHLSDPRFKADPYAWYTRLRAEAPVFRINIGRKQSAWLVTRYRDVQPLLKESRLAKDRTQALTPEQLSRQPWVPSMFRPLERNMLDLDGTDHARLRGLVHKAFTPKLVEDLRARVQEVTDELLDAVPRHSSFDLIRQLALPLPVRIIAEMLGIPKGDRQQFHRWSKVIVSLDTAGGWNTLVAIPSAMAFLRYIRKLIRLRRDHPGNDLVSALAASEEAQSRLSEDELVSMIFLLLIAGHETTVNLIGNGVLALLENRGEWERLRQAPSLIGTAIEELLRHSSPLQVATERFAREDMEIAGISIRRGETVFASLSSANRDPEQFANPDSLNIGREPNRHVAFGHGLHYCLGAPLARMEGAIAISSLLQRAPNLVLKASPESLRWRRGLVLRGLEALPVGD